MPYRESRLKIGAGLLPVPSPLAQNSLWHAVLYDESLRLYPDSQWQRLTAAILGSPRGRTRDAAIRVILGRAVRLPLEDLPTGPALSLPAPLLQAAGLSEPAAAATLVCFPERLELWAPARYEAFLKQATALLAASAELHLLLD